MLINKIACKARWQLLPSVYRKRKKLKIEIKLTLLFSQGICVTESSSKNSLSFATQSNVTEQTEITLQVLWALFATVHQHSENFIVDLINMN